MPEYLHNVLAGAFLITNMTSKDPMFSKSLVTWLYDTTINEAVWVQIAFTGVNAVVGMI